jgi:predicted metal-dependent hydrolase
MRECDEAPSGALLRAFGEFNRGDWFECHETLEDLWIGEEGEMRDFYQGILQIAVALHHWRNGNFGGAVSLLEGGTNYLRRVCPVCQRIDVAGLIAAASRFHEVLVTLGPTRMEAVNRLLIPKLCLVPFSPEKEGGMDSDE